MSATYGKISSDIWNNLKFLALSDLAQIIWLFMVAGPRSGAIPGLVSASKAVLIAEIKEVLGWPQEDIEAAIHELVEAEFVVVGRRCCWLPALVKESFNYPSNPNQVKSWARVLSGIARCPVWDQIRQAVMNVLKDEWKGHFEDECPIPETVQETVPETVEETDPEMVDETLRSSEAERSASEAQAEHSEERKRESDSDFLGGSSDSEGDDRSRATGSAREGQSDHCPSYSFPEKSSSSFGDPELSNEGGQSEQAESSSNGKLGRAKFKLAERLEEIQEASRHSSPNNGVNRPP